MTVRLVVPPLWTREELEASRVQAIEIFRRQRMEEPLEEYLEAFDECQGKVEELLETTVDLVALEQHALAILSDRKLLEAFRYLAGPFISLDDLKTLSEAGSLSRKALEADEALVSRVVETVRVVLDRRRFPWVMEEREPTEAERHAAVLASAALMATQRVATARRNLGKTVQERLVKDALLGTRTFLEVGPRKIKTLSEAPAPGEFCRECMFGSRKADLVVGLLDGRILPIECKVSNSATNSIKRLNNDAAVKAEVWREEFGKRQVIPSAVLSGVYDLQHLETAQERGLTVFWAHDLPRMLAWIDSTWTPPDEVGDAGVSERRRRR